MTENFIYFFPDGLDANMRESFQMMFGDLVCYASMVMLIWPPQ